jgi:hypothetical protein
LVIDVVIPLILNDHIVHDGTSSHHIPHPLRTPSSSRVPNNSPPWLKHTKCPLHILPCSLLLFKPFAFLISRVTHCLDKGGPWWVMSTHASVLVDSVGPPSAEVCRAASSFP